MNINFLPYTYLIGWSKLNKWYYGAQYKSTAHPHNLWVNYFTSSKHVKKYRELYGEPDIIKIRRTFKTREETINWETKLLKRIGVPKNPHFLNKTNNRACINTTESLIYKFRNIKGKTYEEIHGKEKADQLKSLRSQSNIARGPRSEETKIKLSETRKQKFKKGELVVSQAFINSKRRTGINHHNYKKPAWNRGLPRSIITRTKISETMSQFEIQNCLCGFSTKSKSNFTRHKRYNCILI